MYDNIATRKSKSDLERRKRERERLLSEFRQFIEENNPPLMSDLKTKMEPLLNRGYANLPDLLNIVNSKIFPLRVIDVNKDKVVYNNTNDVVSGLKLIDTRDNKETLRNSTNLSATNKGQKSAPNKRHRLKIWLESPLVLTVLGIFGTLLTAYLAYRFGWNR